MQHPSLNHAPKPAGLIIDAGTYRASYRTSTGRRLTLVWTIVGSAPLVTNTGDAALDVMGNDMTATTTVSGELPVYILSMP